MEETINNSLEKFMSRNQKKVSEVFETLCFLEIEVALSTEAATGTHVGGGQILKDRPT
jgi:hypothetical protein